MPEATFFMGVGELGVQMHSLTTQKGPRALLFVLLAVSHNFEIFAAKVLCLGRLSMLCYFATLL